jgi:hypothetical protein
MSSFIINNVYSQIFYDNNRLWSAREFAFFLENSLKDSKTGKYPFTLFCLSKDRRNKYIFSLDKQTKEFQGVRKHDLLQGLVYLRFYSLATSDNDLILILDEIDEENKEIKICFNYGMPVYIRYYQIKNNLSAEEAMQDCKKKIIGICRELAEESPQAVKKMLEGFFRSSILWEPYYDGEIVSRYNADRIIDWRAEFGEISRKYGFLKEDWWKEGRDTKKFPMIQSVKKLFLKRVVLKGVD